jgi:hypothetical protein
MAYPLVLGGRMCRCGWMCRVGQRCWPSSCLLLAFALWFSSESVPECLGVSLGRSRCCFQYFSSRSTFSIYLEFSTTPRTLLIHLSGFLHILITNSIEILDEICGKGTLFDRLGLRIVSRAFFILSPGRCGWMCRVGEHQSVLHR